MTVSCLSGVLLVCSDQIPYSPASRVERVQSHAKCAVAWPMGASLSIDTSFSCLPHCVHVGVMQVPSLQPLQNLLAVCLTLGFLIDRDILLCLAFLQNILTHDDLAVKHPFARL